MESASKVSSSENKQPMPVQPKPSPPTTPRNQGITHSPTITWAPPRKPQKG